MARNRSSREVPPALRPVGRVYELQVIGALDDRVVAILGLTTQARSVWLHPDAVTHIESQRAAPADVEFVLQHIAAAVLRPDWVGVEGRDSRRVRLVHLVRVEGRYLHVALKVVSAADAGSDRDEIWVSSAFPLGERSLTRLQRRDTLFVVSWEAES